MAENIKKRFEIPEEVTWDLTDIFANDEEWEAYYAQTESMLEEYDSFRGRLSESADVLYAALKLEDEISYRVTRDSMSMQDRDRMRIQQMIIISR